jgi:hypothetical protein
MIWAQKDPTYVRAVWNYLDRYAGWIREEDCVIADDGRYGAGSLEREPGARLPKNPHGVVPRIAPMNSRSWRTGQNDNW